MKIKICINSLEGGVANFMFNLRDALKETYEVSIILVNSEIFGFKKLFKNKTSPIINGTETYNYLKGGNTYKLFKKFLTKFENTDLVIANDWFELGAISNFSPNIKVIFILHGDYDYYYNLALLHQEHVSKFVCVSKRIETKLKDLLSERKRDIICINPLIPEISQNSSQSDMKILDVIFVGRLVKSKGFYLLPAIDKLLKDRGILINFHIAGSGYHELPSYIKEWINSSSNVHLLNHVNNTDLRANLPQYNIYLLPSYAEGFPVSLVEAMQAGLVPIVTDLASGIPELVLDSINGYVVRKGDVNAIVNKLVCLNNNKEVLRQMSYKALQHINDYYSADEIKNKFLNTISDVFNNTVELPTVRKIYRSRLDSPLIPDILVSTIRNFYK
jgi:glycosyltransferase involved in cell wall biosynthesis